MTTITNVTMLGLICMMNLGYDYSFVPFVSSTTLTTFFVLFHALWQWKAPVKSSDVIELLENWTISDFEGPLPENKQLGLRTTKGTEVVIKPPPGDFIFDLVCNLPFDFTRTMGF